LPRYPDYLLAHDLALGFPFRGSAFDVCVGALAVAQPTDGDEMERAVGLAVAAVVEAMADAGS
jgi:hypothetical protein